MTFRRYAIYFTPKGSLAEFGASWLGYDIQRGLGATQLTLPGLDVAQITSAPRKYGFHATLKPPFRLADGTTFEELKIAVHTLSEHLKPITLQGLTLQKLGRFLALVPIGETQALNALAERLVKDLDQFRAPSTPEELEKRRASQLSDIQEKHLQDWGYPYVLDQFRFHMTLTGKVGKSQLSDIQNALDPLVTPLLPRPFVISDVTLCGETENGQFVEIERFPLTGTET